MLYTTVQKTYQNFISKPMIPTQMNDGDIVYAPSLRILLQGSWKNKDELLHDENTQGDRPTIVVGDSGGLGEYVRDFLIHQVKG